MFETGLGIYIPIALYVCFIASCLLTLFVNPRIGLYLLAVAVPLQRLRMRIVDYPLGANLITVLILCIGVGALLRGMRPKLGLLAAPLFVMIGYLYLSLWWGTIYSGGEAPVWFTSHRLFVYKDHVAMLMLYVIASQVIETRQHLYRLLICIGLSLIIVDRSALLEFLTHDMSHYRDSKRMSGPFGSLGANELAAFLSQFALFMSGFAFQSELRRWLRWLLYGVAGVTTLTVLYTFSRGAYIGLLMGIATFGLIRCRKVLVLLVVFLACWQVAVPTAVRERITMTRNADEQLDQSAQERVVMWKDAVERFEASPILGDGYGIYNAEVRDNGLRDTHNWYLRVLSDTGILGFLVVVWVLTAMCRTAWAAFKDGDPLISGIGLGLVLALVSLLVMNLFGDRWTYIEINGLLWMLLAIAAARRRFTEAEPHPVCTDATQDTENTEQLEPALCVREPGVSTAHTRCFIASNP